jgi:catechol 2,3-dioxygenase-like lactoylglutathione lyase family enzyme
MTQANRDPGIGLEGRRGAMQLQRIDHIVFTVQNVDATCDFYVRALGMEVVTFGGGRKALQFGQSRINLHEYGREFEPKAEHPAPGTQDICLIAMGPIGDVLRDLERAGVDVLEGPVARSGAVGDIESVYLRDPDGNLIEVSCYSETNQDMTVSTT